MLDCLVHEQGIEPHIRIFDMSKRDDNTFSRADFTYDCATDAYTCPGGMGLKASRRAFKVPRAVSVRTT